MSRRPGPFDDVPDPDLSGAGLGPARREAQASYEHNAVRRVLALLGLSRLARDLAREAAERGLAGPTFPLLEEYVGHVPVRLRVGRLRGVRLLTLPDLFNRFPRTPIGQALAELAAEEDPADGPIGVVFRWAGTRDDRGILRTIKDGRHMVAHTFPSTSEQEGAKIVVRMRLARQPVAVTIETLRGLLLPALADWRPGA